MKIGTYDNSNIFNLMVLFDFTFSDRKYLFGHIWSKKIIVVCLRRNLKYAEFERDVQFFLLFGSEIPFCDKFNRKYRSCLFLPYLGHEIFFSSKFRPKD